MCDLHAGYGSALIMTPPTTEDGINKSFSRYGLPLAQHCRDALLGMVGLDKDISSPWTYAWLVLCAKM